MTRPIYDYWARKGDTPWRRHLFLHVIPGTWLGEDPASCTDWPDHWVGLPLKRRAGRRYVLFAIFGLGDNVPIAPRRRFPAGAFGCWSSLFFGGYEGKQKRRRNI